MFFPCRLGVLVVLLFTCFFLFAQTPADRIEAITSALRAGRFDTALQLVQPELERNSNSAQLWTLRAIALSGEGNKKDALVSFRRALAISAGYLPALEGAAQIEYENGSPTAVDLLEHVLRLRPGDPTSNAMLAVLAYRRRDCTKAVAHFEQSSSLLDSQPGALQQYGDCLVRLKQNEKAIAVFSRALDHAESDSQLRYRLASLQMMAQRPKDAVVTLQPLLQATGASSDILELAASAYEADQNTPEAVRILHQAIVSDPRNVNLYIDFANISLDHQSYQVGVDMINAGLRADPNAAPLYLARGILYVQLAEYDNAESDFEKADALDPRRSMGSAAEGLVAVQENDPDQALTKVRAKLAKAPNDAFLLYLQAEIISQKGPDPDSAEFREAMTSAKKAVALRPSLGGARDILAKFYIQQGENAAAIEQCHKALSADPKDQTALYHLIQALRKSGQTNDLPQLLKRLAALREESTKEEAEHNRYKLVEEKTQNTERSH